MMIKLIIFMVSSLALFLRVFAAAPLYMVVDISNSSASSYPVSYMNTAPIGGWSDEYKTTKLLFRRINPGTFNMGSPSGELGRGSDETQHEVTLSSGYWIGVFEITQKQWQLIYGGRPSYFYNDSYYSMRPVEQATYSAISGSFMSSLRSKTDFDFSLPTEAQWEYACRAGTTTALNSGKNLTSSSSCSNMAELGRYYYNGGNSENKNVDLSGGTTIVGSYKPNAWGLYDMHGNVAEWCSDWYGALSKDAAVDPTGPTSGSYKVCRGGCFRDLANSCRSAKRDYATPPGGNYMIGFRVVCPMRKVTITFDAGEGTCVERTRKVSEWSTVSNLPVPTREHYNFDGWYTQWKGGDKVVSGLEVGGEDIRLYARWTSSITLKEALIVASGSEPIGDIACSGNADWQVDFSHSHDGTASVRSGVIDDSENSVMRFSVSGAGNLSFWWDVDSEGRDYDYAIVSVDGSEKGRIGGEDYGWHFVSVPISGLGSHTIEFRYCKDGSEDDGADCAWVDDLKWVHSIARVSFDLAGGTYSETLSVREISVGNALGKLPLPVRDGYDFVGWFKSASSAVELTAASIVDGDMTLVARWHKKPEIKSLVVTCHDPYDGKMDIAVTMEGVATELAELECTFAATNSVTGVALKTDKIVRIGTTDTAVGSQWKRSFVWNAAEDLGAAKLSDVILTISLRKPLGGVQLWEGGPYWAEYNVGAENPEDYGYYFAWGDVVGYKREDDKWVAVDGSSSDYEFTYQNLVVKGNVDVLKDNGCLLSNRNLAPQCDAAHVHQGKSWRMPTYEELNMLSSIPYCETVWTEMNGIHGYLFRGRGAYAENTIFLPAVGAGYQKKYGSPPDSYGSYWSSSIDSDYPSYAGSLYFTGNWISCRDDEKERWIGQCIRPVRDANSDSLASNLSSVSTNISWTGIPGAIEYTNLMGAIHTNPEQYWAGTSCVFTEPSQVTGYTFVAWTPASITPQRSGDLTVRANWRANTYRIVYQANGGAGVMADTSATYDQDVKLATNGFTRLGYEFKGWSDEPNGDVRYAKNSTVRNLTSEEAGVVTLYAMWTKMPVSIVSVTAEEQVPWNGKVDITVVLSGLEADVAVVDCRFGATNVTNNSDLKIEHIVQIGTDSGSGDAWTRVFEWSVAEDVGLARIDDIVLNVSILGSIQTATIAHLKYSGAPVSNISYENLRGATHTNPSTYYEGGSIELSAPSEVEGYTFVGWDPAAITPDMKGDLTVRATWQANTYRIAYDANGGLGEMANTDALYDQDVSLSANAFTRLGYEFSGWALVPDGEVVYGDLETVRNLTSSANSSVTIHAIWRIVRYSIRYDNLRGAATNNPLSYTVEDSIFFKPLDNQSQAMFNGWSQARILKGTTGDLVVSALWELREVSDFVPEAVLAVSNDDSHPWTAEFIAPEWTLQSGMIERNGETSLSIEFDGAAKLIYSRKTSCEDVDVSGDRTDGLLVTVDGEEVDFSSGITEWEEKCIDLRKDGHHVLTWTYFKDRRTDKGDDCAWVKDINVMPYRSVFFTYDEEVLGDGPETILVLSGSAFEIPSCVTLVKPKHRFVGWQIGSEICPTGLSMDMGMKDITAKAVWEAKLLAKPSITVPSVYDAQSVEVVISSEDADATILYAIDDGEYAHYSAPVLIEGSHTVYAYCTKDDYFDSDVVSVYTRRLPQNAAECLGGDGITYNVAGENGWVRDLNVSHDGQASMKSAAIEDKKSSPISAIVEGPGELSFWTKVSSETDAEDGFAYDGLMLYLDGRRQWEEYLGGDVEWERHVLRIEGDGSHIITWSYEKDKTGSSGEDCAWLDEVVWTPKLSRPEVIEGASEAVKVAFDQWVADYGVSNPSAVNVNAFILGLEPSATKEVIQEKVEEELANLDLGKLVEGDISAAVAEIQAKYPNAKVDLAPVEDLNTSAHLYKLVIKLK